MDLTIPPRNLFAFNEDFNEDISGWNVSGVTDFSSLFWEANSFDQNLGKWDVSRAETMKCMFCGAKSYRGAGLEQWGNKLHHVHDMYNMFEGSGIRSDVVSLNGWNVSSVTMMREMFRNTKNFHETLCWDTVGHATIATDMFNETNACFDKSCVLPSIAEQAGCSGAKSLGTVLVMALMGLVTLVFAR